MPVLLSDRDIKAQIAAGRIQLDPYEAALIQPSSIDFRLDRLFRLFDNHKYPVIDPAEEQDELTRLVEVAPGGTSVLRTDAGWLLHTNHFLAADRQEGAAVTPTLSTTHERFAFIEAGTAAAAAPQGAADLIPLLCSPLEDRTVALLPDEGAQEAERIATLVTVQVDPAGRTVRLSPGAPQFTDEASVAYRL